MRSILGKGNNYILSSCYLTQVFTSAPQILLKRISATKLLNNLGFHRIKSFKYHYYYPNLCFLYISAQNYILFCIFNNV